MALRVGVPGRVMGGVTCDVTEVTRLVVGPGTGVGVCIVAECDVGDVGGVVAVVGGMLLPSPSSGDNLPPGVATIRRVTGDDRRRWATRQRWLRLDIALPCGGRHSRKKIAGGPAGFVAMAGTLA